MFCGCKTKTVEQLPSLTETNRRLTLNSLNDAKIFGETVQVLTRKFPISLTLINCQRCLKSENKEIFTNVSRFSNYFATNHRCPRNAISTSQMFTSSAYRPRTIVTPIVLDFSYFNCNRKRLQTLNLTLKVTLTLKLTLQLTLILHLSLINVTLYYRKLRMP